MTSPSQVCLLAVPGVLRLRSSALTGLLGEAVLPTTLHQHSIGLLGALNDLLHRDLSYPEGGTAHICMLQSPVSHPRFS